MFSRIKQNLASCSHNAKPYQEYVIDNVAEEMLKTNDLYRGIIRISKRDRNDAYVTSDALDACIYVGGIKRTERGQERQGKLSASTKKSLGDNDSNSTQRPKYCGEVVLILDRAEGLSFTGTVSLNKPGPPGKNDRDNRAPRIAWFRPKDNRVPLMVIPVSCPQLDGVIHDEVLYEAKITYWSARHFYPRGEIIRKIDDNWSHFSKLTNTILLDHHVIHTPFDTSITEVTKGLPRSARDMDREYSHRRCDFTRKLVFTIDAADARDVNQAVHCKLLSDGTFEVGVHIADVSSLVRPGTMLDIEARRRGATTYLVDGIVPMLPAILCEELCTLNPYVERLAFSVIWKMQADGVILDTWFGKSIIKSRAKLAYEDAQSVIDTGLLPGDANVSPFYVRQVENAITALFRLSQQLRRRRYLHRALSMDSVKLCFDLDHQGQPQDMWIHELKEANKLIEEFMFCANTTVAETIMRHYPDEALLHRPALPIERRLNEFIDLVKKLGYDFNGSSADSLQEAVDSITDEHIKQALLALGTRPMQRAQYCCAGTLDVTEHNHYTLNESPYTHFTSPVRRYADIIVHRQLLAAIEDQVHCNLTTEMVQKIALQCNRKEDDAKNAQEASTMLYLAKFLHKLTLRQGPIIRPGVVLAVHAEAIEIYVPDYGLQRKISMESLPLERFEYKNRTLTVYWQRGVVLDTALEKRLYGKARERKNDHVVKDGMDGMEALKDEVDDVGSSLSNIQVTDESVTNSPCVDHEIAPVDDSPMHEPELDEATCMQRFRIFTELQVLVQMDMEQFTPGVRIFPVNPFGDLGPLYP
ncbi:uncharacterized protein BYT42DRAFT_609187 [Radiomyces spectabilis]|uniref:uncharacterized protein n=1 Tax=Radiomyces spectabilis TaxID=64574 RepID=UPI00221FE832|nr:uncharacterized protein BYT42DRAFT_609187 [Radiomyces spectabilis]KAI8393392.1 hypothetical protein BYT42DRAFT_609187 [Radiomyces spectabilis]